MSETITRSAVRALPIVGARYRPPAEPILKSLPAGASLLLRPEPSNPFDPNAVQVLITTESINDTADIETLTVLLEGYGLEIGQVTDEPAEHEWHLGYIPKTYAGALAPAMGGETWGAELQFSGSGQSMVKPVDQDD